MEEALDLSFDRLLMMMMISHSTLSMRNFSDKQTDTFYVQKLVSENRTVYKIMSRNTAQPDRPQRKI